MSGSASKKVETWLAGIECNGATRFLPRCIVMTSTDEAVICTELRVVHYLTKTGRTCMQSAELIKPKEEPKVEKPKVIEKRTNLYAVTMPLGIVKRGLCRDSH
jgi:hypothetical protein